jgi:hypothetical protein
MGNRSPLTIPQAWHQTKQGLKKNMYVGARSAEGVETILKAICDKIGLDLENVVEVPPAEPEVLTPPGPPEVVEVTATPAAEVAPPAPEIVEPEPPEVVETAGPIEPPKPPKRSRKKATKKVSKN